MKRWLSLGLLLSAVCAGGSARANAHAHTQAATSVITLDVHGADIHDVISLLAVQSGKNIVTDASVGAVPITLRLEGVSFARALAVLSHAYDLQVRHDGNIYIIGSGAAMNKKYGDGGDALGSRTETINLQNSTAVEVAKSLTDAIPLGTVVIPDQRGSRLIVTGDAASVKRVRNLVRSLDSPRADSIGVNGAVAVRLKYARVEDAAKQLANVLPNQGYVADEAQNAIVFTGGAETVAVGRSFLHAIDVPRPQVSFEVRVLDISISKNSNIGTIFGSPGAGMGAARTSFANSSIAIEATLNGLIANGRAKILARPRVTTQNNSEATLLVGQTYPVAILTSSSAVASQEVKYIDIGVKLRIKPSISSDGTIVAELNPEYSELLSITANGYPVVGTRKLNSILRVRNDETIVLGGLLQETDSETVTKVPLLGDVPVFGAVFRNRVHRQTKDEIVFLITPHLL